MEAIMSVVYDEYGSSDIDSDNSSNDINGGEQQQHQHQQIQIQMMMSEEYYTVDGDTATTGMNILTPQQLQIGFLVPRIAGAITLLSSFCMIIMASKRCGHLFHRLILGMSFYLFIMGVSMLYGSAAIPASQQDDNAAIGNVGTITSCNIQGFFLYLSFNMSLFYYASFAVYSYVAIQNNFLKTQYLWIEKYIHIGVHIYPLVSAIFLWTDNAYGNTGYGVCNVQDGYPLGCGAGDHNSIDYVPCEYESKHIRNGRMPLFWIIPNTIQLLFPSIIMMILYFKVKKREEQLAYQKHKKKKSIIQMGFTPKRIVRQSAVYLIPLWWAVLPYIIFEGLTYSMYGKVNRNDPKWDKLFYFAIYADINLSLFGFWTMLSYIWFSVKKRSLSSCCSQRRCTSTSGIAAPSAAKTAGSTAAAAAAAAAATNNLNNTRNIEYIFSSQGEIEIETDESDQDDEDVTERVDDPSPLPPTQDKPKPKYSFNIFDGTQDASGAFAQFIHDGDSDDERYDNLETEKWNDVQDHV